MTNPATKRVIPVKKCLLASIIGSAIASGGVYAQEDSGALEEIIVTSQKRQQNIMDVPISVIALDGTKLDEVGVENLEDLTAYVPNVHFTETGISTQLRIRGIGSDNSQGFEQSVGMYVDGVYRSRAQLLRAPLYDLERVEVMRGPQNTLFGKNTIAGAIDVITAKPLGTFEGAISASREFEFGTYELNSYVTGPLSEDINGRVAVRYYDDPGYMTNTGPGKDNKDDPQTREKSIRGSLNWAAGDDTDVLLVAEYGTFDTEGRAVEVVFDQPSPNLNPLAPLGVPDALYFNTFPAGLTYQNIIQARSGAAMDSNLDFNRQTDSPEFSNNTMDSLTLEVKHDFDGYEFTSLTSRLTYEYDELCDCDFTPAPIYDLELFEEYDQLSQEFRLTSPGGQFVDWIVGAYYQTYDQSFDDVFNVLNNSIAPQRVSEISVFQNALNPASPIAPPTFGGTGVARNFTQSSDSRAIFGEATINFTDRLRLTIGARYTDENKDATKILNSVDINNNNAVLDSPLLASIFKSTFLVETKQSDDHDLSGSRNEEAFTPAVNLSFDVNDDIMVYAKYSEGFKAGGFDPRSNQIEFVEPLSNPARTISAFEFEEETSKSFEAGSKMVLAGGKGELNIALYHTKYEDLQISSFDGRVGFNVGNAKETVVQGLELDGRWKLTDSITANYGFAYLDFEYEDFQNGNCYFGQTPIAGSTFCDYTGERGVYTPEFTVNTSLEYFRSLDSGWDLLGLVDWQWVDEHQVHTNLDPAGLIDDYMMLSARVGIENDRWSFALLGKNLLDQEVVTFAANLPTSENFFATNSHYAFIRRPRTLALDVKFKF